MTDFHFSQSAPASAPKCSLTERLTQGEKERDALLLALRQVADRAYCQYIEQMRRDECKGVEHKLRHGKFGQVELHAHNKGAEHLGAHRAIMRFLELHSIGMAKPDTPAAANAEALLVADDVLSEIKRQQEGATFHFETTRGAVERTLAAINALRPAAADAVALTDVLRDMLAIQEACGLHTDEYAPGSVIEYIKELEDDTALTHRATTATPGYKLVPLKCTPEMRAAWDRAPQSEDDDKDFAGAYAALLAAAPDIETTAASVDTSPACWRCDGTGDIHRPDGTYIGECDCPASAWKRSRATTAADQQGDTASIDTPAFRQRLHSARMAISDAEKRAADRDLIEYIDGRAQQGAAQAQADDVAAITAVIDNIADNWPMKKYTLEEIEIRLRAERAAMAAPATSGGGNG